MDDISSPLRIQITEILFLDGEEQDNQASTNADNAAGSPAVYVTKSLASLTQIRFTNSEHLARAAQKLQLCFLCRFKKKIEPQRYVAKTRVKFTHCNFHLRCNHYQNRFSDFQLLQNNPTLNHNQFLRTLYAERKLTLVPNFQSYPNMRSSAPFSRLTWP